jgi:hypothetical protein
LRDGEIPRWDLSQQRNTPEPIYSVLLRVGIELEWLPYISAQEVDGFVDMLTEVSQMDRQRLKWKLRVAADRASRAKQGVSSYLQVKAQHDALSDPLLQPAATIVAMEAPMVKVTGSRVLRRDATINEGVARWTNR